MFSYSILVLFSFSSLVLSRHDNIEDIESLFLFLGSSVRALNERAANLMNSQVVRILRQTKEIIQTHPLNSLFLMIFIVLGFLPFIVFAAFVSSSFLLVLLSALTVFGGTFAVAFVSFLVVLFPILMFGGGVAVFVYLTHCFIVSIIQVVKSLGSIVKLEVQGSLSYLITE